MGHAVVCHRCHLVTRNYLWPFPGYNSYTWLFLCMKHGVQSDPKVSEIHDPQTDTAMLAVTDPPPMNRRLCQQHREMDVQYRARRRELSLLQLRLDQPGIVRLLEVCLHHRRTRQESSFLHVQPWRSCTPRPSTTRNISSSEREPANDVWQQTLFSVNCNWNQKKQKAETIMYCSWWTITAEITLVLCSSYIKM